jgi:serine/threonine-protein kinase
VAKRNPWEDKWHIIEALGRGGQGVTARCVRVDGADTTPRVLKKLLRQDDLERRKRMHREVSALQTLLNVGIPGYVDGNTDQFADIKVPLYFVMEFIPGATLEKAVQEHAFELDKALQLFSSLLDTVDYCHRNDLVHRDIKPENIVLRDHDVARPVLIDFGLTFNAEDDAEQLTEEAQHLGNRFLFLPELRGSTQEKRDRRSDVTACCGVLFFALTGHAPVALDDASGAKPHQRPMAKAALNRIAPARLKALNSLFDQAFPVAIDRRWQSIAALKQAVHAISDPEAAESAEDPDLRIERIRANLKKQATHKHAVQTLSQLQGILRGIQEGEQAVIDKMGNEIDWRIGGNHVNVAAGGCGNTVSFGRLGSSAELVRMSFSGQVTGVEAVLTVVAGERRTDLLRVPLNEPIPLEKVKLSVVNYLLSALEALV